MLMMQELTPEEQREWKELAKKIQDTAAPPDAIFVTISARDQIFGEVGKVYAVKFKDVLKGLWHLVDRDDTYHIVVYNRDLDQPAIVAGVPCLPKSFPKWHSLYHQVPCSMTFKNVGWSSIIIGSHSKLEPDGNNSARPCLSMLGWK
ncbi:hypothetical protein JHK86_009869 [Glycine max]|nr:hypothetical protein JHK86_009869 [Glycine max]